ncbi:hypothetical protein CALCODRAFT_557670 [Calocera cornea HHB12733]|uniref:Uncharacterized protein n=1 Tax=Calocera cornea HHB12733 TaxID=1353952 RepID=A0A165DNJ3_9BASI|nr:hypothetical protein CALCODRAFT_557670 [Calocera cornea HHB12733]
MSTATFTGPNLSNKRKEELVSIAYALGLPNVDGALRDGLIKSIKTYLTDNKDTLSTDPRFSGLYPSTRTRRVVARLTVEGEEEEEESEAPTTLNGRTVEAAIERAEAKEAAEAVAESGEIVVATSSQTVVLAPPPPSILASFDWKTTPFEWLESVRELLSDEELIAGVTLVVEMLWLLSAVLPIHYHPLTVPKFPRTAPPAGAPPAPRSTTIAFPVPHPTLATFSALFTWALPSLIIPHIAGTLISVARPRKQLDPITVSIGPIGGVPVNARIAGALVSLLFAFASAIYEAPSSSSTATIVV